ncbi:gamma-glutamyltransferase [Aurantimonas sp. MSK8Z-1]|uniref:gamma-glutamyltransferase n=1 Tax=Mangrovibrevibacter kandeliae TaxID=2968473 RepID=UPI0021179D36|nr:gamma-glutamyltransferase [Aurantimonas sp. MSK8Z-1]MCW4114609.1 gamma-glutamyltransferase [Aurantimonas sp. MSK8Z-1]
MSIHTLRRRSGIVALALLLQTGAAALAASPKPVAAEHGMVVTAQHTASDVGVAILQNGGNAVDAAVAVGYTLAVTYPRAGNLGGGGFMTIRMADGRTTFLDFREKAPLGATKDMYLDASGKPVKGASTSGWLAVGVPGTVAGLEYARVHYGTKDRADLIAPALTYARNGFTFDPGDAAAFAGGSAKLAKDPSAGPIFLGDDGKPPASGEWLVQPDLATTLAKISATGVDGFYRGATAEAIVAASKAGGGVLSQEDLAEYRVRELKPVTCDYRGYTVISSPPPSSGGVIICEILNILKAYPLGESGSGSAKTVHWMIEAMRHAYVDRNTELGDPDFVDNPVDRLLSEAHAAEIREEIDPDHAGVSADLKPEGFGESHETTHYSIVDEAGNAVAVTYTLNGSYGAGVMAPGTGVLMNNEMDDFTQKPGVPNLYGLVQGEANAIAPKKSPLSSMSPTIVTKDGKVAMVIGSPGGSRIITITLEAILNVIDHGMTIQEAIDAPRIHHQWLPDTVAMEPFALSPDTVAKLEAMGHTVAVDKDWPVWGEAAGILVGGPSLADQDPKRPQRYFGAEDSRAAAGAARGY